MMSISCKEERIRHIHEIASTLINTKYLPDEHLGKQEIKISPSYTSNTLREVSCLNYLHKIALEFPNLIFTAKNEFGIEKPVLCALRPTCSPHFRFDDLQSFCTVFANLFQYEPYEPYKPMTLVSPTQLLAWKCVGDCLDCSTFVASLLLGYGLNAFVVYGKACAGSVCDLEKPHALSPFDDRIHQDLPRPSHETLAHAWVMVLDNDRPIFVEPSTGELYDFFAKVHKMPYTRLDAIWNTQNYYINLQKGDIKQTLFNLTSASMWRTVFDYKTQTPPLSWTNQIELKDEMLKMEYMPNGKRTALYHKAKLEKFAGHLNAQKLIQRHSLYQDIEQTIVENCTEWFEAKSRPDFLVKRIITQSSLYQEHLPNKAILIIMRSTLDGVDLTFEPTQMDGLLRRIHDFDKSIKEIYQDRKNGLIERNIYLLDDNQHADEERFCLNPDDSKFRSLYAFKVE